MKKIFTLITALSFVATAAISQCVIDQNAVMGSNFFSPRPDSLPCVERTVAYDQVIQIHVPDSIDLQDFGSPFPFILYVDSMIITGVNGLPTNISYTSNPADGKLYGGDYGCAQVSGTTTDAAGRYPITFNGSLTAHGMPFQPFFDGDTTIDFATLQALSQGQFDLYVDVIEPGAACRPATGIGKNLESALNMTMRVFPNPSQGNFAVSFNTGSYVSGTLSVMDMNGKVVYAEAVNFSGRFETNLSLGNMAKGLYSVVLKTDGGSAHKNISVE